MAECAREPMQVIASAAELPAGRRVWGSGDRSGPQEREALDWLTLARVLGWDVGVSHEAGLRSLNLPDGSRWIVLACGPDCLSRDAVAQLAARLAREPLLIVARAAAPEHAFARLAGVSRRPERITGRSVRWSGPGPPRCWHWAWELPASALARSGDAEVWATLEGAPLIAARRVGRGVVATLGCHPSEARDRDGAGTALLRHLLIWGTPGPVAWLDFSGSLVLRMDDPGGAQNVHLRSWTYRKLGEPEWAALAAALRQRQARLSVGYVAGWVDDGEAARGELTVAGGPARRVPGAVHPSRSVHYRDLAGQAPGTLHDYAAEYRGIQALRSAGAGDVELHGYTHMHPDGVAWARAPDRYEATAWFRELGCDAAAFIASRPAAEHPLVLGSAALHRDFGARPTTLICPGDAWTDEALERAHDLGLQLVSNTYLAIRHGRRFCWSTHVCAPYLDQPSSSWFVAGLPVVGYFHDRDPACEGVQWVSHWLNGWRRAGASRLMDFRELAGALGCRVSCAARDGEWLLTVRSLDAPPRVRPVPVRLRAERGAPPSRVSVRFDGRSLSLRVDADTDGTGRVVLPADEALAPSPS